jgi:hypothetical protein
VPCMAAAVSCSGTSFGLMEIRLLDPPSAAEAQLAHRSLDADSCTQRHQQPLHMQQRYQLWMLAGIKRV